jgi:hypothetical protein
VDFADLVYSKDFSSKSELFPKNLPRPRKYRGIFSAKSAKFIHRLRELTQIITPQSHEDTKKKKTGLTGLKGLFYHRVHPPSADLRRTENF